MQSPSQVIKSTRALYTQPLKSISAEQRVLIMFKFIVQLLQRVQGCCVGFAGRKRGKILWRFGWKGTYESLRITGGKGGGIVGQVVHGPFRAFFSVAFRGVSLSSIFWIGRHLLVWCLYYREWLYVMSILVCTLRVDSLSTICDI